MLPLPNLAIRSAGVVVLLYGLLGLILITLAQFEITDLGELGGRDRRRDHHLAVRIGSLGDGPVPAAGSTSFRGSRSTTSRTISAISWCAWPVNRA